jgi:hypothetical protein
MKNLFRLICAAILISTFVSCANNQSGTTSTNSSSATRTYTADDLQKTGKRDAGEALRAADPSVTTTTGR